MAKDVLGDEALGLAPASGPSQIHYNISQSTINYLLVREYEARRALRAAHAKILEAVNTPGNYQLLHDALDELSRGMGAGR